MTGPLVVTLPGATPVDLGSFFIRGLEISPMDARIVFSQTIQFTAEVIGAGAETIVWELLPLPDGDPNENFGTITPGGVYTPPDISDVTSAGGLIVRATSDALNNIVAVARIGLFGTVVNPSRVVVILPGPGDVGGIPANVTVAMPPASVILPGPGELGGLQSNVTVGGPPIAVIIPSAGELGGHQPNVTVALPPVMLILPGQGDAGGLQPNTTVAKPPVTVEIENQP